MLNQEIKDKVLEFVKARPHGCSSQDISKELGINRLTLTKYLSTLYSEGILGYKKVGMAKLWYFEKNPLLRGMLHDSDQSKTLKLLFNSMGVGVLILDQKGKVVWLNKKIKNVVGEVSGKFISECLTEIVELNEKANDTKKPQTETISIKSNKYLINASSILDKEGTVVGIIDIFSEQ